MLPIQSSFEVLSVTHDKQKLDEISRRKEKWEAETVLRSFDKLPERGEFSTTSSIPVSRVYSPIEVADVDYLRD